MAPFSPLFKYSFSTFDEQTYQHSPTPPNPCKHAPPPTFNTLIDSLSTTPPKTLWKTSWKLGSLEVWKLGFHAPLLHEDTKGTQGPGHFTVRRVAPHSLSPSLAFLSILGNADLGEHRGAQRGQRDTEAGGVLSHAGRVIGSLEVWRLGSLDRPHAARLSQRTRRTTKVHEGLTGIGTADVPSLR